MDLGSEQFGDARLQELIGVQYLGDQQWLLRTTDKKVVYALERTGDTDFVLKQAAIEKSSAARKLEADTRRSLFTGGKLSGSSVGVHPEAWLQEVSDDGYISSSLRDSSEKRWGLDKAWSCDDLLLNGSILADIGVVDLEVTSPRLQSSRNIVLDSSEQHSRRGADEPSLVRVVDASSLHGGKQTITLQSNGQIRVWQFDQAALDHELGLWKQMVGYVDTEQLAMKVNGQPVGQPSTPRTGLDSPKYGKDDPKNEPHVGGNTWAGGTGGSDTAGLGGRGGPYRLDKGHPVHQVSQAKKDEVSAETRAKAQAMAQEALASKLEEIDMSEREWETYQRYFDRVEPEVSQLRAILGNLESVEQERTWLKHQSSGELDDAKLVDGVAGERLVFKRRGQSDSPFQTKHQTKPKRMLFVMDVSGSMYRFNGQDQRLERVLETSLMVMESFAGFDKTLEYAIVGHSGDSPEIPFVDFGSPPADRKERLKVLQKMVAHTQYCMSGDHTVESIARGVQRVTESEADDYFVLVVSDANLERYRIQPARVGALLAADPRVKAHAIFIASIANEADRIRQQLPAGRGHVCLDTADLPRTFQKIFSSAFRS